MGDDRRPLAHQLRRLLRQRRPARPGRRAFGGLGDRLAARPARDLAGAGRLRDHRPLRQLRRRGPVGAARRGAHRRPLPPGPAGPPDRHRGPATRHPRASRATWQHDRPGMAVPPQAVHRLRAATQRDIRADVEPARRHRGSRRGDPAAYIVKEELRALLALAGTSPDRRDIRRQLWTFYTRAASSTAPEVHRLAATVEACWPAIEAAILTGHSNARCEAYHRVGRHEGRHAYGFRNPDNQRRRIPWRCTRQHRRASATITGMPGQA